MVSAWGVGEGVGRGAGGGGKEKGGRGGSDCNVVKLCWFSRRL